jgi:hypothetical protein
MQFLHKLTKVNAIPKSKEKLWLASKTWINLPAQKP